MARSTPQYEQALWPRDPLSPCSGTAKGSARLSLPISIPTPKAALTRASFLVGSWGVCRREGPVISFQCPLTSGIGQRPSQAPSVEKSLPTIALVGGLPEGQATAAWGWDVT